MNNHSDLDEGALRCIEDYLDSIDTSLRGGGMSQAGRRSILGDLRTQILEMSQDRSEGAPTLEDVQGVIAGLDPAESYAEVNEQILVDVAPAPRLSRLALLGAIWTPLCWSIWFIPGIRSKSFEVERPLFWIVEMFTMTAPICTMILGLVAIQHIRASHGRLCGIGLAVADALLFPVVVLGAAASFVLAMGLNELLDLQEVEIGTDAMTNPVVLGIAIVIWCAIGVAAGAAAWRASTRPVDGCRHPASER